MLSFNDLVAIAPEQTWIQFSETDRETTRREVAKQLYSNAGARTRAYQNTLCLRVLQRWLRSELDLSRDAAIWTPTGGLSSLWEFVNGAALLLKRARLAIFPSETLDLTELTAPQEWVDLPDWAAHYYLPIQLNSDECWLRILGYTTHAQVKSKGRYDAVDRTYNLAQSALTANLNPLWVNLEVSPLPQPATTPVSSPHPTSAQSWIQRLSANRHYSPRLDLPFEQWGALMANAHWRQALHYERTHPPDEVIDFAAWIAGDFVAGGWQAIRDITASFTTLPELAIARGSVTPIGGQKDVSLGEHTIELQVIRDLETSQSRDETSEIGILIQARLKQGSPPLSANLRLSVAFRDDDQGDQSSSLEQELSADSPDPMVCLPRLLGKPGEYFRVILSLDGSSATESFVIH
jgi:hypothetical protein